MAKGLRRLSHAQGGQFLPFSSSERRDIGHHRLGLLRQPLISPGFLSAGAPPSSLTVLHHGLPQQTQASRCLLSQAWVRDDYLPFGLFPGLFLHILCSSSFPHEASFHFSSISSLYHIQSILQGPPQDSPPLGGPTQLLLFPWISPLPNAYKHPNSSSPSLPTSSPFPYFPPSPLSLSSFSSFLLNKN